MLKEALGTGPTIEEAQTAAIEQLNAPEGVDVSTEVLEIPVKKTLGLFGGNPAKVRAYYEEPDFSPAEIFIRTILNGMGIKEVKIEVEEFENDIRIQLDCGDDDRTIIGRRGETLDAIQYLTRLNISKKNEVYKRVLINVGNYREKREATLRGMARKSAERVKKYGKNVSLDPMNPYERRIVHTTIQDIEGVDSHSVGSDNARKVVISSAAGGKAVGENRPQKDNFRDKTKSNTASTVRNTPPPRTSKAPRAPKSDASSTSRYGKIEPKKN
ncbi:MAG TPA: RNA-binding cell elongation regulator Jag/EloR [Clostridia bacterium]|nr:RNA-binding cell elongation regulator Jag/EloR [Clostridia bacterium]